MKKLNYYYACGICRSIFTMVELLVVIAIIVILAGLLLPALKKARESAYKTVCANKLKQMNVGAISYTQDYDGWILSGLSSWSPYTSWYTQIAEIIGKERPAISTNVCNTPVFFKCPAETIDFGSSSNGLFDYTHYGINNNITGCITSGTQQSKVNRVRTPSIAVFMGDNNQRSSCLIGYYVYIAYRHGRPNPYGLANILYFDGHVASIRTRINAATPNGF